MNSNLPLKPTIASVPQDGTPADPIASSTLVEVAKRHRVSVSFLRKEIERGKLQVFILAHGTHRHKLRVLPLDERAWLEAMPKYPS